MMGLMDFMFSLGTLTAPLWVVALFWVLDDWRWPVRIIALGLLLVGLYSWQVAKAQPMLAAASQSSGRSLSYGNVLRQPLFMLLLLVMIGYGAAEWGQGNWFVSYAVDGLGLASEQARLLLAWFTGGMVLSRLGFALLLRWLRAASLMLLLGMMRMMMGIMVRIIMSILMSILMLLLRLLMLLILLLMLLIAIILLMLVLLLVMLLALLKNIIMGVDTKLK
jgi:fucose permease